MLNQQLLRQPMILFKKDLLKKIYWMQSINDNY